MEIAFFTDSYPPTLDGVAAITGGLSRTLHRLGHSVTVYAPDPHIGLASHDEWADGVRVVRLRSVPVPLYGQYRWPVFPFGVLRRTRGAGTADVIHLHTPGALGSMAFLTARRFDRPLVGTFHTNLRAMSGSVPRKLLVPLFFRVAWWYNLGTYWRCDAVTAPTASARAELLAGARKPFQHPIEIVPNGIDLDRFRPGERVPDWRGRCGLPDGALVTYLGRLTVDKGVHRFLDAFAAAARSRAIVGIVAGDGPEEAAVRARLAGDRVLRDRVRYVGPVAEAEKAALLGQTDLFVLPSTSDTSSVALLEAMACGTMVVAPALGGAAEVVEDGVTGRRVDVLVPGALAQAIEELVDRPDLRARLAAQALAWVREHGSLEAMARRLISLYRHLLAEPRFHADRTAR
jgi:glycosyltransferase involved in cell wall biosynthesis